MLCFALKYQDQLYYRSLKTGETVSFGSGKKDTVPVQGMAEGQISVSEKGEMLTVRTRAPFQPAVYDLTLGTVFHADRNSGTSLYASRMTGVSPLVFHLPLNGIVRAGRAQGNDICIALPFVSGQHFQLRIEDGNVRVEDQESTNGLYLNGKRIKAAILRQGDTLHILTVCIRLVNNTLEFENVGTSLRLTEQKQQDFAAPLGEEKTGSVQAPKILRYRLSPRLQNELPQETIVLDRPPQKGQEYHPTSRIANLVSMGVMAATGLSMGAASPALAFARTASIAMSVWNMASAGKADKKRQAEIEEYNQRRETEYKAYIEAQRARIGAVAAEQRGIITEENPAPADCLAMLQKTDRRIWERRPCDRDFLHVRIGMGYEPLCVPIKNYAENRGLMMEDDELEALCNQIAEENELVDYIPRRLPLRETPTVGVFGNRDQAVHIMRNIIVSLTTHHSPNEVRLVGIFPNAERGRWASLRWLPHIWDSSSQFRYLAFDKARAHHLCEMLYDELRRRAEAAAEGGITAQKAPPPLPHYVIVLGSREAVEQEPLLDLLASGGTAIGASTFFLFDDLYYLPRDCGTFLDLTQDFPYVYDRFHANKRAAFSRDPSVSAPDFSAFARKMAALELEDQLRSNALPSSITFLEGFGAKSVEALQIPERWRSHPVCDSLSTPIGVLPNGSHYCLDIHYKAHGAHGLLAGTTGSGKSELLRTWILSMAVNYHPHEVNFVIIDYKGGGMANKLEALPHVVGKITNIDTNISRSLVSLKREAKRRMILLEKYPGVDDVDQYMQLYYSGKAAEPMPHLIIVSDEFAELKKEEPEFMKELSSLARVGRSVGMHLVLATQRPAGVVDDQIESNSRFRICMKVGSVQDSKEMIKRPDAAGITQRGRAYVRIGEDEEFVLLQSYWSGAVYAEEKEVQYPDLVRIVDVSGERLRRAEQTADGRQQTVGSDQLTAIVQYIAALAERQNIRRLRGPWMPPLPEHVPYHTVLKAPRFDGSTWQGERPPFCIPIGIYDRPAMQEQGVQYMDFDAAPHYAVYGAPLSGKTTLLHTLITGLAMTFSPAEAEIILLDFGGGSLSRFESLPHVSALIREGEPEQMERFKERMTAEMQKRKICFRKEKVANYAQYVQKKQNLPAVFVIIDNEIRLTAFADDIAPFLIELSMSGSDCGIHLVFTSNNPNKTGMNLQANIGGNIALHMADRNDYRGVVAELPEGCGLPSNPGRGLIRDKAAAEFQTAVFAPEGAEAGAALEALIAEMRTAFAGDTPSAPKSMPDTVTVETLAPFYGVPDLLPVGLDYDSFQPVYLNLHEKHSMLISAQDAAEGSAVLGALGALMLTNRDSRIYVLDARGALSALKAKAAMYASDAAGCERIVQALCREAEKREDALYAAQDAGAENPEAAAGRAQICILIDGIRKTAEMLSDESREILVQLCRHTGQLGILTAAHGSAEEIESDLLFDSLTVALIDNPEISDYAQENWQKGICIGGKLRDHDWFSQKNAENRSEPIREGDGIVCDCGKMLRVKLIR